MMDNATLQTFLDTYGTDVILIGLNNGKAIHLNYQSGTVTSDDVELVTINGVDLIKVKNTDMTNGNIYYTYHVTEFVECVSVAPDKAYIDPRLLR